MHLREWVIAMKDLGRVGIIGRFKPVHNGHASLLESACEKAEHVMIGIGSSNRYDARNPFMPEESRDMIDLVLKPRFDNYQIVFVPDFGHIPEYRDGIRWKKFIVDKFGDLDAFITGDGYVAQLMKDRYRIIDSMEIVSEHRKREGKGSLTRLEIARGYDYARLVPAPVADYLKQNMLVDRLRKEFGQDIIRTLTRPGYDPGQNDDIRTQQLYVQGA
jgi:cytidyltransferase-like protein